MLGHGAIGQFAIGQVGAATGAEAITLDKWYVPLSTPVRSLSGLKPSLQQFSAFPNPFPFVPFGWFEELSKPASLTRPALRTGQQQFIAWQPAPSPFVPTDWFEALSEPPRVRPRLHPARQQFAAADTLVIPISKTMPWFEALSEPTRTRPGLRASMQQFYAAPAQLRPNPATTASLAALETKDTFLGGAQSWNRPTGAEIGVEATVQPLAEIGIVGDVAPSLTVSISIS